MAGDRVVTRLIATSRTFDPGPASDADDLGPYAVLGEFAHHLVDLVHQGREAEVRTTLDTVEEILRTGTAHDVTVVRNGLLESLQNIVSHRDVPVSGDAFVPLLGERSAAQWHELNEVWLMAAADRPAGGVVTVDDYLGVTDPDLRRHLQANRRELTDGRMIGVSDVLAYEQRKADSIRAATMRLRRITLICFSAVVVVLLISAAITR